MSERRYGRWGGEPNGHAEDMARCIEKVPNAMIAQGMVSKQCNNKRGKGKDGLYCGIHAKQHPATAAEE